MIRLEEIPVSELTCPDLAAAGREESAEAFRLACRGSRGELVFVPATGLVGSWWRRDLRWWRGTTPEKAAAILGASCRCSA